MLLVILAFLFPAHAGSWDSSPESEKTRLSGYFEYKEDLRINDREREKGLTQYLEEQEKWDRNVERARKELVAQGKKVVDESGRVKLYREWLADKRTEERERENLEKKFHADNLKTRSSWKRPISEVTELDIYAKRPRYEQKRRVLFGATSSFKSLRNMRPGSGGVSSGGGGGPIGDTGASPNMNDMGDQGYTPPPAPQPPIMPEMTPDMTAPPPPGDMTGNMDNPAPIPPPAMPPGFGNEGDFPAPPPPPPGFEEGDSF